MSGFLKLAQVLQTPPHLALKDLETALADGHIKAIGLRNGKTQEVIPRETWAHYRIVEDFDGCAIFADPNNPDADIAGSYTIALLKLRGLEHQLAANFRRQVSRLQNPFRSYLRGVRRTGSRREF